MGILGIHDEITLLLHVLKPRLLLRMARCDSQCVQSWRFCLDPTLSHSTVHMHHAWLRQGLHQTRLRPCRIGAESILRFSLVPPDWCYRRLWTCLEAIKSQLMKIFY